MLNNELKFIGAKRGIRLSEKLNEFMDDRRLAAPTRQLPVNFLLPLLSAAVLEEDDDLQDTWAWLLVNAGDAATPMELRTAYVEILKGMSAFDVKNLSVMAKASIEFQGKTAVPLLETWNLPESVVARDEGSGSGQPVSDELGISLSNLIRLGCTSPGSATFGGKALLQFATVTHLGRALYLACSSTEYLTMRADRLVAVLRGQRRRKKPCSFRYHLH